MKRRYQSADGGTKLDIEFGDAHVNWLDHFVVDRKGKNKARSKAHVGKLLTIAKGTWKELTHAQKAVISIGREHYEK